MALVTADLRWRWAPFAELDARAMYDALALRARVFVVEQDCAYVDPDGLDPGAWHLLGRAGGALVAYLRVLPPGAWMPERLPERTIGRVVTAPEHRGRGLGRLLMAEGLRRAEATFGPEPLALAAQSHLRRFYEAFGFRVTGPEFLEDGIPHLPMRREV